MNGNAGDARSRGMAAIAGPERDPLDWGPMDPQDRLRDLIGGADCAVCRRRVPLAGVRLLASREDLAFVELTCAACGSVALGIVVEIDETDGSPRRVLEGASPGELMPEDEARLAGSPPIGAADVLAMRDFLAGYGGDLRSLVDPDPGRGSAGPAA